MYLEKDNLVIVSIKHNSEASIILYLHISAYLVVDVDDETLALESSNFLVVLN